MRFNSGLDMRTKVEVRDGQGNIRGVGKILGDCPVPQVLVQYTDGSQEWWREDMVRKLDDREIELLEATGLRFDWSAEGEDETS